MTAKRIIVALNLPAGDLEKIAKAKHVATCMHDNPYFPSAPVAYATLMGQIAEVDTAQIEVGTGRHGAAAERDAKWLVVESSLRQRRTYVETVANGFPAPERPAVVVSSGLDIKNAVGPRKMGLSVRQLSRSGSVSVSARHPGGAASFDWQSSTDGTTWKDEARTTQSEAELHDLTPGVLYWFRVRVLGPAGLGDWSTPITLRAR